MCIRDRLRPLQEYRDHRSGHRIERRPVPEQLCDVDGERVEQPLVLRRVSIQERGVVREPMNAPSSHTHRDAPAETPLLVCAAPERTLARDPVSYTHLRAHETP